MIIAPFLSDRFSEKTRTRNNGKFAMRTLKLIAGLALIGALASPAGAQMANSMGNSKGSMGNMGSAPMAKGSMSDGMSSEHQKMPMHPKMGAKMAMCHRMSHHQMMHNRKCAMMMKHHRMTKHDM